jgi:hypothetical protein
VRDSGFTPGGDSSALVDSDEEEKRPEALRLKAPQETDPDENFDDLINDMNLIGEISINEEDGLLSFPDFCRLFQLIKKHVEPRLVSQLTKLKAERRRVLD